MSVPRLRAPQNIVNTSLVPIHTVFAVIFAPSETQNRPYLLESDYTW